MSEIPFDMDVVITTRTVYAKFTIRNIEIKIGEDAKIDVILFQSEPVQTPLHKTIYIPIEVYSNWTYDEASIIEYIKNYLQQIYS